MERILCLFVRAYFSGGREGNSIYKYELYLVVLMLFYEMRDTKCQKRRSDSGLSTPFMIQRTQHRFDKLWFCVDGGIVHEGDGYSGIWRPRQITVNGFTCS